MHNPKCLAGSSELLVRIKAEKSKGNIFSGEYVACLTGT